MRKVCQMQSWLHSPSQVQYFCGIYISDSDVPDNTLMMLHEPGALHLRLISIPKPGTGSFWDPHTFFPPWKMGASSQKSSGKPCGPFTDGDFQPPKIKFCRLFSGRKAHTPRGTDQPQCQCCAAAKCRFCTSPFPKATFRIKRINCGFP